jgi:uncharacterized protein YjbI with pentapeptide repeats
LLIAFISDICENVSQNFIPTKIDMQNIIEKYKTGHRYFTNLDFDRSSKLSGLMLAESIFDNCCFSSDFSQTDFTNSKFFNCNLKGSNFSESILKNTIFENCEVENANFRNAKIDGTNFNNCHYFGQLVAITISNGEFETFKDALVKELYENLPEFNQVSDHLNDELAYEVYGELSLKLFEDITINSETTNFTTKCFQFFNLLGDRKDANIDNLLVIGIYEGLYSNKKCNDIARKLLKGRNRAIYEHWMQKGNIRAEY